MAVNDNEITLKSKQNSYCNSYKRQFFKQTHFFSDEDDQAYVSEIDNYSSDCSSCSDNSDCSDLDVENEFAYDFDDSDNYRCQFKCDYECKQCKCKQCDPHECSIKCVKYVKYEEIKTDRHGADGSGNKDADRGGVGGADSKDSGGGNEDSDDNGSDRDSDNSIPSLDNYGGDDKGSDGESDNNWAEDGSDVHEEYDDNGAKDGDKDNFGSTSESLKPEDDSVEGGGDAAFRKWILRNKPESKKFEFTPEQESYLERIFQVKKFINIFDIGKNKHALKIMNCLF